MVFDPPVRFVDDDEEEIIELPSDDEDSETEEQYQRIPFPTKILEILKSNDLKYHRHELETRKMTEMFNSLSMSSLSMQLPLTAQTSLPDGDQSFFARMGKLFINFLHQNGLEEFDKNKMYLFRKRFMLMIDRRTNTPSKDDEMWLYEPPSDCRDIPFDAVNEWPINASKQSILPNSKYNAEREQEQKGADLPSDSDDEHWKCPLCDTQMDADDMTCSNSKCPRDQHGNAMFNPLRMDRNIGSGQGESQLVTFSIVYREQNSVQCYIYWNGQMHRFLPQEMEQTKHILKDIFLIQSTKYPGNQSIFEAESTERLFEDLQDKIVDPVFMNFRKTCRERKGHGL